MRIEIETKELAEIINKSFALLQGDLANDLLTQFVDALAEWLKKQAPMRFNCNPSNIICPHFTDGVKCDDCEYSDVKPQFDKAEFLKEAGI